MIKIKKNLDWMRNSVNQSSKYTGGDIDLYGDEWVISRGLVIDLISQVRESKVPEIPSFVAREIEFMQRKEEELGRLPDILGTSDLGEDKEWFNDAQKWKRSNFMKYCNAYANGYEIEERKYSVLNKRGVPLIMMGGHGKVIEIGHPQNMDNYVGDVGKYYDVWLTEKEIKDFDEKYWIFAEPVEELEG